jgi:Txe/YoeB family toxin of Txe-Axe toxin-antitoxin module
MSIEKLEGKQLSTGFVYYDNKEVANKINELITLVNQLEWRIIQLNEKT